MQIIENKLIKEKVYIEKLESGFTIMCIPKCNTRKKYAVCAVGYGSNYNKFFIRKESREVKIPDGVAHYLEHKMFEQENGVNSLDVLTSLGVEANAYTTNDHTAYLFESTKNFEEALDELLGYVQNPYFTDENVEKEKGIISQEINMYDDDPEWKVYINCMKALYKINPIRIDIAGSIESICDINKNILYECYNNFYVPENMILVVVGNFEPESIIEEVKKKITTPSKIKAEIIKYDEPASINKKEISEKMDISMPLFTIGYKVNPVENEKVKKNLAIEIILEILFGQSSECYKKLYGQGLIYEPLWTSFEWSKEDFAHVLIQGKTEDVETTRNIIEVEIEDIKQNGINLNDFERAKRKIYGMYVREFNEVSTEATVFVTNYFKGINPFDYIEKYKALSKEYVGQILKDVFDSNKMVISTIMPQ